MRHVNKFFAAVMAVVMAFAMAPFAFAQTDGTATNETGSITISNAAKGVEYKVYKLFDATNSVAMDGDKSVSITYTSTEDIPSALTAYFTKDANGSITATDAAKVAGGLSDKAIAALTAWAEGQDAVRTVVADGSTLVFAGLEYGYYVVTSSQGGKAISVDSTNPNATIIDKNTTTPINNPKKDVDDDDVFIGQTVTYTISFGTANYEGEKKITKYTILDDFARGALTDIKVTSIKIGDDPYTVTVDGKATVPQFVNGPITIPWVAEVAEGESLYDAASLYANGATLEITYTAVVADAAAIDGSGNTNNVTISYENVDKNGNPGGGSDHAEKTIYTYAIALKKVDASGNSLKDAKFQFPFYVKETSAADGAYIYAGTVQGEGLVNEITTPEDGLIIVKGVAKGTYSITETAAPAAYNKLAAPVSVEAIATNAETTSVTTYFDEKGEKVDQEVENGFSVLVSIDNLAATPIVVVNHTGAELPSTGGIGTTIFYIVGGVMVAGAIIFLLAKRRVSVEE